MHVISASRRTDIPAFYCDWLMNRVRTGFARWRNPYSGVPGEVSLRRGDVAAVVFWSKNYTPLLQHLPELDSLGWGMCFQFTITGLPKVFEPEVPPAESMVECARLLAERYTPEAVLWRYDPILISSVTDVQYHIARFRELASALEGVTRRCYFSFPNLYARVVRNIQALKAKLGIECFEIPLRQRMETAAELAQIAAEYGIEMYSCCGEYLVGGMIKKAHCVDGPLLRRLFPDRIGRIRERPTRKECGCYESVDIGVYDTCPHGCVYCYANMNKETASARHQAHDPAADTLAGDSGLGDSPSSRPYDPQMRMDLGD